MPASTSRPSPDFKFKWLGVADWWWKSQPRLDLNHWPYGVGTFVNLILVTIHP